MATESDLPVLEVRGLDFAWPGVPLFHNLNLQIPAGVSAICGEEGSGKTTLLRLLSGDLQADGGSFVLRNAGAGLQAQARSERAFRTDPRSAANDAISATAWWATLLSRYPTFDTALAREFAQSFGLAPHIEKPMYMLSAGSKRKVWLCAAFAAGTTLTLIDEPFAALDLASVRFLMSLLTEASGHTSRAWVLGDHAPPEGLLLNSLLVLGG